MNNRCALCYGDTTEIDGGRELRRPSLVNGYHQLARRGHVDEVQLRLIASPMHVEAAERLNVEAHRGLLLRRWS